MPRWLLSFLMLREDQMIRWGRLNGRLCLGMGVALLAVSAFCYYLVNVRLGGAVAMFQNIQEDVLRHLARDSSAATRSLGVQMKAFSGFFLAQHEMLKVLWLLMGASGLTFVYAGLMALRVREILEEPSPSFGSLPP